MHQSTTTDAATDVSPEHDVENKESPASLLTSYSAAVATDPHPSNTAPPTAPVQRMLRRRQRGSLVERRRRMVIPQLKILEVSAGHAPQGPRL
ncbi:hypothetical protein V495_00555 [Pseudogymnoascus sp. VKM F-4514 (FW-929)]|nr:hypothetical protein V495_00555 [Pseudogymnoascus sp. VKM F-4514 (FW-929)]KFY67651.1 hypothetical protein V497_00273 [Pseudogymnoascus sp. VKM F-4516 (FW-969)]